MVSGNIAYRQHSTQNCGKQNPLWSRVTSHFCLVHFPIHLCLSIANSSTVCKTVANKINYYGPEGCLMHVFIAVFARCFYVRSDIFMHCLLISLNSHTHFIFSSKLRKHYAKRILSNLCVLSLFGDLAFLLLSIGTSRWLFCCLMSLFGASWLI